MTVVSLCVFVWMREMMIVLLLLFRDGADVTSEKIPHRSFCPSKKMRNIRHVSTEKNRESKRTREQEKRTRCVYKDNDLC